MCAVCEEKGNYIDVRGTDNVITPEERAYVNSGGLLGVKMYLEEVSKVRKEWSTQQCVGFMMARLDLLVARCYPHLGS